MPCSCCWRLLPALLLALCIAKDESYWQNQFIGKRFMTTYLFFHHVFLILRHYFRFWIKDKTPICMELPEELCQLADMEKLRREKAIEDYRMNEDGLLIKPAMEFNREKQFTEE